MPLPFNLQKLPDEALDMLRYLGKTVRAQTSSEIEAGSGMSSRLVGKAIRRLVNYDFIHYNAATTAYELTSDGKIAVQQIVENDSQTASGGSQPTSQMSSTTRRLTVVSPRSLMAGRATDLYFGINPPDARTGLLPSTAHVELKISAVGGTLSASVVSLDIPPEKAAAPIKIALTPAQPGKTVRVRVDAFQSFEFDSMEALGGMYFDVQVASEVPAPGAASAGPASRAVGMDLTLRPPR